MTTVAQLERTLQLVDDVIAQGERALALLVDVQVVLRDELADAKRAAAAGEAA